MTNTKHINVSLPRMQPDHRRILEAVCHVITCAKERFGAATRYDIVKTLFIADKAHLNKYGRPITFDNYAALKHGPVPKFSYDLIKGDTSAWQKIGESNVYWECRPSRSVPNAIEYVPTRKKLKRIRLSESDVEALDAALHTVKQLSFGQIRQLTHEDPAYVDAWKEDSHKKSFSMRYDLLIDDRQLAKELVEDLAYASRHLS